MKAFSRLLLVLMSTATIAACGSDDESLGDALGASRPQVRLAHISPIAPAVTLDREGSIPGETSRLQYGEASDYFNVDDSAADWNVRTSNEGILVGAVRFDAERGRKYTVLALAESLTVNGVALIDDPTNPSLTSDDARVRFFNGSYNAANIDIYLSGLDQNIAGLNPDTATIAFRNAAPGSGNDSLRRPGGTYKATVTTGGTKDILFQGRLTIEENRDILLMTVPTMTESDGIRLLVKVQGSPGTVAVPVL